MSLDAIELTHLRYFIALAEELHFGRAAARLHIAQPPLTRQIRLLEERLECLLFERTTRTTRLTPAGADLLDRARTIVAEAEAAMRAVRSLGRGEEGLLRLATAPSLMLGALPHWIRRFRENYPRVELRLSEMGSSAVLGAVRAGTADLGLIRGMDRAREIVTHLEWKEEMAAIVPADFDAGEGMRLGRLRAEPFVFFPRSIGPSFYDEVMSQCRRAGFTPLVVQEARQWSSIISLVSAGIGVSIGPMGVSELLPNAARFVPLRNFRTSVRLIGRTGAAHPPALRFVSLAAGREFSGESRRPD